MNRKLKEAYKRVLVNKINIVEMAGAGGVWQWLRGLLGRRFQNHFGDMSDLLGFMRVSRERMWTPAEWIEFTGKPMEEWDPWERAMFMGRGLHWNRVGQARWGGRGSPSDKGGIRRAREFMDSIDDEFFLPPSTQRVRDLFIDEWGGHFIRTQDGHVYYLSPESGLIRINDNFIPGGEMYPGHESWVLPDGTPNPNYRSPIQHITPDPEPTIPPQVVDPQIDPDDLVQPWERIRPGSGTSPPPNDLPGAGDPQGVSGVYNTDPWRYA
jgi:hypothetical protein